jgi:hypothetical protein|tara:strand:+ start:1685 stop:2551 length:867 start_codon:yes stop_codon:yes gene_type:complete
MPYGFLSNTDNGYAQIDGENLQLKVLLSGSVVPGTIGSSSSDKDSAGNYYYPSTGRGSSWEVNRSAISIALPTGYSTSSVFIFAKPSNDNQSTKMFGCQFYTSYGVGYFKITCPEWLEWGTNTVDYKVCVVNNDEDESAGYGLRVFSASGGLGFSSNRVNFKGEQFAYGSPARNMTSTSSSDYGSTVIGPLYFDKPAEKLDYYCLINGCAADSGWQVVTGGSPYSAFSQNQSTRGMYWYQPFVQYSYGGSTPSVKMFSDYSQSIAYGGIYGNQVDLASTRGIVIGTFV